MKIYKNYERKRDSTEKPISMVAEMCGSGCYASLTLHIPNSKKIEDIRELDFFNEFKTFQYQKITDNTFYQLQYLKNKIEMYCMEEDFVTYEGCFALKLYYCDNRHQLYVRDMYE